MAVAAPDGAGWGVSVEPVGEVSCLLGRLRGRSGGAPVALGLDLPIGLPAAFAERHCPGVSCFPEFLRGLGSTPDFFRVCDTAAEIGPTRPFYPRRGMKGMKRHQLETALGLSFKELHRVCDRKTTNRPSAAALFWTLGANQVGKGALSAWRDLLLPALTGARPPALWPFDGDLATLLGGSEAVIAETYPAEAMRQLEVEMGGSKRSQADRAKLVQKLRGRLSDLSARPDAALSTCLDDGFGSAPDGEDRFDAFLGLLAMVKVVSHPAADTVPDDQRVKRWEGWILGQSVPT